MFCVLGWCFDPPGLQLEEGVYRSAGPLARHGQRVLEDDLGEERTDAGHADSLQ